MQCAERHAAGTGPLSAARSTLSARYSDEIGRNDIDVDIGEHVNIHEYQAKELLRGEGIPIPPGEVASTPDEAEAAARRLGGKVVVKAQVHVGGRGKAGGVKLAGSPEEARAVAAKILGMKIKGLTVEKVLVTVAADIASEA